MTPDPRNRPHGDLDYHEHRYAELLGDKVVQGALWLDLGAGTRVHGGWRGVTQAELAERARLLVGTDVMAPHLRRNPYLGAAVVADAAALPFRDAALDVVSANMVVEHLEHPRRVLSEVYRVLKPGGPFVFATPNRGHPVVWLSAKVLGRQARRKAATAVEQRSPEHVFPTFYRCNTEIAIRTLAAEVGFRAPELTVFNSIPFFRHVPLLHTLERAWNRLTGHARMRRLRSNILACLHKP